LAFTTFLPGFGKTAFLVSTDSLTVFAPVAFLAGDIFVAVGFSSVALEFAWWRQRP